MSDAERHLDQHVNTESFNIENVNREINIRTMFYP